MNQFADIAAVPAITILCLLSAQIFKAVTDGRWNVHIPALCAAVGLLLGVGCYLWAPGYIPADNALVAAAIGAVSGWAATGAHQTVKQTMKEG